MLHRIKAKIALKQKLTEYERCYFLLFGKWEEVHKFLKKEKYMYSTRTGIYNSPNTDCFKTLVERCETIISKENLNWTNLTNTRKKDNNNVT